MLDVTVFELSAIKEFNEDGIDDLTESEIDKVENACRVFFTFGSASGWYSSLDIFDMTAEQNVIIN
ncbi:hypothetical protein [Marinicellulosiphila megalodicopiae]|uniref:hypothetical protein n=1 Tax=Marinicellulosiphila megalodicopiae TaxID=2724896 RepID=UPI003BB03C96